MHHADFDPAILRSFIAGIDLGSFAKAAERVGRSTSAVSAQIRKLEEQAGTALFQKTGRHLGLTQAGATMLSYARRLIELNDEAADAVRGTDLEGWVRLGMQEDFGEAALPGVLGQFGRAHPNVKIEAHVTRNTDLLERMETNQLDLALVWGDSSVSASGVSSQRIAAPAMRWIGPASAPWALQPGEPVPLIAFDRPCVFHSAAVSALDRAGIAWRLAFTSPSLSGLHAAAAAGLGVSVRTAVGLPPTVAAIDARAAGLPALPTIALTLFRRSERPSPCVERLAAIVLAALREMVSQGERIAA